MPTTTTTPATGACQLTRLRSPTGSEAGGESATAQVERAGAIHEAQRDSVRRGAGERFLLTLWTDDPELAARADAAGIDRIGVDLEREGKRERQAGLGTWISPHSVDRLPSLRAAIAHAQLFARVNPLSSQTAGEVDLLIAEGVEVLMLPMFAGAKQAASFVELVGGRAGVVLLLETLSAAREIERIVSVDGVCEIHVGINDLALSLGMRNRFEVLDCELIEHVSRCVLEAGLRFGIGGIGRAGDESLPIASDLVYAQYPRLGATAALISRAFLSCKHGTVDLAGEVARSRALLAYWDGASAPQLRQARRMFRAALAQCEGW